MIENATLYTGDCREILRSLPAESVQCVVTSPPYLGLRDYSAPASIWGGKEDCAHQWKTFVQPAANGIIHEGGMSGKTLSGMSATRRPKKSSFCECGAWRGCLGSEPTLQLYLEHIVEVFKEVWRVLRKDGTVFVNIGDSYASGGNGGHNKSASFHGHDSREGGDLKGARKDIPGFKAKDRMGQPHRVAFALQDAGWFFRDEWVWEKKSPMPGSQRDRATVAHEFVFMFTKKSKYFYDIEAIAEAVTGGAHARGNGHPVQRLTPRGGYQDRGDADLVDTRYPRSVVQFPPQPFVAELCTACHEYYHDGAGYLPKHGEGLEAKPVCKCGRWDAWLSHYASFPTSLPERCIKAGTSEAGCCAECGAPWKRVVEKVSKKKTPAGWDTNLTTSHKGKIGRYPGKGNGVDLRHTPDQPNRPPNGRALSKGYRSGNKTRKIADHSPSSTHMGSSIPWSAEESRTLTLGWVPTCKCWGIPLQPVPCTVLDLFNGTGRSGLAALRLGRRYIGVDVKSEYIELSTNYLTEELKHPPLIEAILTSEAEQMELPL